MRNFKMVGLLKLKIFDKNDEILALGYEITCLMLSSDLKTKRFFF